MSPGRTIARVPMREAMRTLFRAPSLGADVWVAWVAWCSDKAWVAPVKQKLNKLILTNMHNSKCLNVHLMTIVKCDAFEPTLVKENFTENHPGKYTSKNKTPLDMNPLP